MNTATRRGRDRRGKRVSPPKPTGDVCALTDGRTTLDTFEFTVERAAVALQGEIATAD